MGDELSRRKVLSCRTEERAHKWQFLNAQRSVDTVLRDTLSSSTGRTYLA